MLAQLRGVLVVFALLTLITGIVYPLAIHVVAQTVFPNQASGSMIVDNGRVVGSRLIGQLFDDPKYFWGRPSATDPVAYNAASSNGSNLGPTNPALIDAVKDRVAKLRSADPKNTSPIPVDLVTASASGLDPHITPAAAEYQVARVSKARGLEPSAVSKLIVDYTETRTFGLLGEDRVNVLLLNRALDALASKHG